ncbi:hypothetical protein ACP275_04G203100 [Erythranthe tilingii]
MKLFLNPLVTSLLGCAVGTWICYTLLDEHKKKPLVSERVTEHVRARSTATEADDDDDEELIVETRDGSPLHFITKIKSYTFCLLHPVDKLETREFEAGDHKWKLIIYPYGKERNNKYVSVYLAMTNTSSLPIDWEFDAIFTIFLHNQILDKYFCCRVKRRFNGAKCKWGFPKFISTNELVDRSNGYLVDDNLVLGAEVFVLKRQRVVENVNVLRPSIFVRDWEISEFLKLENVWTSEEFNIWGFNWKIELYPNGGDLSSKDNAVKIHLVCVSAHAFATHQKVKAEFYMRLLDRSDAVIHDSGKLFHWFTSSSTTRGPSFKSLAGCCTLSVDIYLQVAV